MSKYIGEVVRVIAILCVGLYPVNDLNAGWFDKINKSQAIQQGVAIGTQVAVKALEEKDVRLPELQQSFQQLSSYFEQGSIGVNSQGMVEAFQELPGDASSLVEDLNKSITNYLSKNTSRRSSLDSAVRGMTFVTYIQDAQGGWTDMRKARIGAPQDLSSLDGQQVYLMENQYINNGTDWVVSSHSGMVSISSVEGEMLYVAELEAWVMFQAIDYGKTNRHRQALQRKQAASAQSQGSMGYLQDIASRSTKSIDELMNLSNAQSIRNKTLLFNGYWLGMTVNDFMKLSLHYFRDIFNQASNFEVKEHSASYIDKYCGYSPDSNVQGIRATGYYGNGKFELEVVYNSQEVLSMAFGETILDSLFNVKDLSTRDFIQMFMNNYGIPEMKPIAGNPAGLEYISPKGFTLSIADLGGRKKGFLLRKTPSSSKRKFR